MTGMPWSTAACTVGWMAVPSWARMMITLAPSVMSCSTSVACFSADEPASVPVYEPPAFSTTSLMLGSSHLAQRSSLKLFHDTPTLQPAADCEPPAPPDAAGDAVPEQPANTMAATPTTAANLRICMWSPPRSGRSRSQRGGPAVGYNVDEALIASIC